MPREGATAFDPIPVWVLTRKGAFRILSEPVIDVVGTLHHLHEQQYAEMMPPTRPFRPDYEYYLKRALDGRLAVIVARDEWLKPVGYLVFRIDPSPITGAMCATEELWYITPAARGATLAQRMIEYFEYVARALGLAELYMGYSKKDASALYERAGLTCFAVVYGKALDAQPSST